MGILTDFINKFRNQKDKKIYADILNNRTPIFSMYGQDIFTSDVVRQAIDCIVCELKKLNVKHVLLENSEPVPVNKGPLAAVLREPNDRMTQSDLIERMMRGYFIKQNSFVIKTWVQKGGVKTITGLWPIQPSTVDFLQDPTGELFVKFVFPNTYEVTLPYEDVIHLKKDYYRNEFMGGDENGRASYKELIKTLDLNDKVLKGVSNALDSSYAINGVMKYNTVLDKGKMEKNIAEFENKLRNNESGIIGLDLQGEFIPLQNKIKLVDEATLKFIDEKILRHFGVPLPILTGDYNKEQYEAFYQKTLEPLITSLNQEFTKKVFSKREKDLGNQIKFYPHELIFMTTTQKIDLFNMLTDTSSCYKNEVRVAFGLEPLEELKNQIAVSSNKQNAENNTENNDGGISQNG